jgi:outer membrane receptor protein involved in Fe transport
VDRSPDTTRTAWNDTNTVRSEAIDVTSFKAFGFLENVFQITDELTLNVGGRADYFEINRDLNLSPRVNASYRTEGGTTLRAAWGWYYQSPLYQQLKYSYSSDSNTKAQRATHYILGLEQRISFDDDNGSLTAKLDGFYKKYDNLISYQRVFTSDIANPNSGPRYVRNNDAEGFAKGFDAMITLAWRNLSFWVSYGYLDTQEDLLKDTIGFYPRFTDQRHSLAMALDYKLGDGWSCGARFTYGSGQPYTPLQFDKIKQRWVETAPKNSVNYPAYQRVDVRVDKRFTIFGLDGFFFLDVNNVLNYDNVRNYSYSRDYDGNTIVNTNYLWPILPSFGLTINF